MKRFFSALVCCALSATAQAAAMTLSSSDVRDGATISQRFVFRGFGCSGQNVTPTFSFGGVPKNAKSLALTLWDPDAPTGAVGFVHWTLYRIPASATSTAGLHAVNGPTDFGRPGYGGPCPPPGDKPHHYIFTLYALDTAFPFDAHTSYAAFRFTIRGHVIATAKIVARYGR